MADLDRIFWSVDYRPVWKWLVFLSTSRPRDPARGAQDCLPGRGPSLGGLRRHFVTCMSHHLTYREIRNERIICFHVVDWPADVYCRLLLMLCSRPSIGTCLYLAWYTRPHSAVVPLRVVLFPRGSAAQATHQGTFNFVFVLVRHHEVMTNALRYRACHNLNQISWLHCCYTTN